MPTRPTLPSSALIGLDPQTSLPLLLIEGSTVHLVLGAGAFALIELIEEMERAEDISRAYLLYEFDGTTEQPCTIRWFTEFTDISSVRQAATMIFDYAGITFLGAQSHGVSEHSFGTDTSLQLDASVLGRFGLNGGTLWHDGTRTLRVWRLVDGAASGPAGAELIHEHAQLSHFSWENPPAAFDQVQDYDHEVGQSVR